MPTNTNTLYFTCRASPAAPSASAPKGTGSCLGLAVVEPAGEGKTLSCLSLAPTRWEKSTGERGCAWVAMGMLWGRDTQAHGGEAEGVPAAERGIVRSLENLGGAAERRCGGEVIFHVGSLLSFRCSGHGCPSVLQDPVQVLDEAGTGEGLLDHLLRADAWGWLWAEAFQNG